MQPYHAVDEIVVRLHHVYKYVRDFGNRTDICVQFHRIWMNRPTVTCLHFGAHAKFPNMMALVHCDVAVDDDALVYWFAHVDDVSSKQLKMCQSHRLDPVRFSSLNSYSMRVEERLRSTHYSLD